MQEVNLSNLVSGRIPNATASEIILAIPSAKRKLERIIAREGDGGGIRATCEYLGHIIVEEILISRATKKSAPLMQ